MQSDSSHRLSRLLPWLGALLLFTLAGAAGRRNRPIPRPAWRT
jgi:hypothetical protein